MVRGLNDYKKIIFAPIVCVLFYSHTEKTVMQSTGIATTLILATQVGMYLYYVGTEATKSFLYQNKEKLLLYAIAHYALNYLFFSALKPVKLRL